MTDSGRRQPPGSGATRSGRPCQGDALVVPCPPTPEAPFGDWIGQLFLEGITAGCGGNDFCPDQGIPNEQMATFLVKAFQVPHD